MKLYIVTRADLSPGARAAQSVHTAYAFSAKHPDEQQHWYENSNNIVLLEADDEKALYALSLRARTEGISHAVFREPDFDDTITGVAIGPEGAHLVSNLRLTLRDAA